NGPMLIAVSLGKPAHNDQADLDNLRNQEQKSTQQEISKQQAKAHNTIQQQTQDAKEQAKQKIQAEAKQQQEQAAQKIQAEAKQQQEQAAQKIREEADQAKQQVGSRGQDAIDNVAQQEIDKQNKAIDQQAQQEIDKQNESIQKQANQKEAQEDKSIAKKVKQQAAKKEKSSGQDDKEKFLESKASDPRLTDLRTDLQKTKGVDGVSLPLVNKKGDAAVYTVTATTAPSSRATEELVQTLRNEVIPKATRGKQMGADVGATTASYIDLASEISNKLPLVIGIVLVLSFLLLLLAFRSLLVPLKAVVMNVFSILAAFGVVTYAFDHTWTARLIGLEGPIPIVSFVPLMLFAILFGLSMDYEVFLMTHVREQWKETNDPHEAVVHGLASTARVITSAAMIMVSVFLAFVINGDPTVKQFGLGMAVAVAVDATVVRCVLVPAIMSLLGSVGWWMPNWLERATPKFSIEGNEWFAEHEDQASAQANQPQDDRKKQYEPDRAD
ncbi:MAG: MMPL family transporter, partial [Rubrobacteraceae bacterium]|nr:MMPL family transporter [Rubrobacteraceae bacterium]